MLLSNLWDRAFLVPGWSYLLKTSVRDLAALERGIKGAACGFVVLDPRISGELANGTTGQVSLTEADRSLLSLIAQGYSNAAIAADLSVSERTIEGRVGALYRQLGIVTADQSRHPRALAVLRFIEQFSGAAVLKT